MPPRLWTLSLHQGLLSLQAQAAWLLVPLWGEAQGWGLEAVGLVLAAQSVGAALGAVGSGLVAQRCGPGPSVRISSWVVVALLLAHLVLPNAWVAWVILRFGAGLAAGLNRGLVPYLATEHGGVAQRSLAMTTAGYLAGQAAGLPLALLIGGHFSVPIGLGILGLALAISSLRLPALANAPQRLRPPTPALLWSELRTPSTWSVVALYVVSFAAGGALLAYLPLWWTQEQGQAPGHLAIWLSLGGALQTGLLLLLSQMQVRHTVARRIAGWMLASGLICLIGPWLWQATPPGFWLILMLLTRAGRMPAIQESLFCQGDRDARLVRLSLCNGLAEVGRALGGVGASWLFAGYGFSAVSLATGLLALLTLGLLPALKPMPARVEVG